MRHVRFQRFGPFEDTRRKRLALARKQRLEREKFPLLAEVIADQQPGADAVMAQRAEDWARWQQEHRDGRAAAWRKARHRLAAHGENVRAVLRRLWSEAPYPASPDYLLSMLHSFNVGRLDPDNPPWIYRGPGLGAFDLKGIRQKARVRMERRA